MNPDVFVRRLGQPYADISAMYMEDTSALLIKQDRIVMPSEGIPQNFSCKCGAKRHVFRALCPGGGKNGEPGISVLRVSASCKADDGMVIKIVGLRPVCITGPDSDQLFQIENWRFICTLNSVVISVKDAGDAAFPKKNHRVGNGLEPFRDVAFQCLAGLRIMVVDEGDSAFRPRFYKGIGEQTPHIKVLSVLGCAQK